MARFIRRFNDIQHIIELRRDAWAMWCSGARARGSFIRESQQY